MYNENIDLEEDNESSNGFDFKNFYYNNKKLIWLLIGIIVFIIFVSMITSCGRTSTNNENNNQNNQSGNLEPVLVLNNKSETVAIGSSVQINATVTNYPNAYISYSSSDNNIASVNNSGLVTGKNLGTATIYVIYVHNGNQVLRDECTVTVSLGNESIKVSSISFPDGDLVMGLGTNFDLGDKLEINPYNAYIYQKHFESQNSNIAKVDSDGKIKAVSPGTTYVTASINNIFESKIKVIVLNNNITAEIVKGPESINISSGLIKLKISETKKIDYTITPVNANINNLTWTSSNSKVATVNDKGEVTGLMDGSSTITVTAPNGVSSKTIIEVSKYGDDVLVENVSYYQSVISMTVGSTYSIDPVVTPSNAVNKSLTFASLNPSIASVNTTSGGISGIIVANAVGSTTITFTSSNGKQGSVIVNVIDNNNNNNNYNSGGSSSSSSSNNNNNNSSSSSSSSTVRYARITTSSSNITLLSSSYTTFKIKANIDGTFNLSTSRAEIYFPSSQAKSINVKANQEVEIQIRGTKPGSMSVSGYVTIDFVPNDKSVKNTSDIVRVTVK